MAIAVVAHGAFKNAGSDSNGFTSTSLNTTGATLLVVGLAETDGGTGTISDSKANTWHQLTVNNEVSANQSTIWYAFDKSGSALVVGSGHTVTVTATGDFPGLTVIALSGTDTTAPFDLQSGHAIGGAATSVQPGSLTPSAANCIVITVYSTDDTTGTAINSGFTKADTLATGSFGETGTALGYIIQTTATAVNPTWSETNASGLTASMASFKAAAGGGGSRGLFLTPPVSGIGSGGSFFRNPLQAPHQMVRRDRLFVPAWLGKAA